MSRIEREKPRVTPWAKFKEKRRVTKIDKESQNTSVGIRVIWVVILSTASKD